MEKYPGMHRQSNAGLQSFSMRKKQQSVMESYKRIESWAGKRHVHESQGQGYL